MSPCLFPTTITSHFTNIDIWKLNTCQEKIEGCTAQSSYRRATTSEKSFKIHLLSNLGIFDFLQEMKGKTCCVAANQLDSDFGVN